MGLQVSEREPKTGELTIVQQFVDDGLEGSSLIWDRHRDRLFAHRYGVWRRFTLLLDDNQLELEDEGTISVSGDPPDAVDCGAGESGDVFMDEAGSSLYAVFSPANRLQVLPLDTEGDLRHVQSVEDLWGVERAVISDHGSHVYVTRNIALLVFQRNSDTGRLTKTPHNTRLVYRANALSISSDGRYLFVFENHGRTMRIFGLAGNPSNPRELGTLEAFWDSPFWLRSWQNRCHARARKGTPAVDAFCMDMAFGVEWQDESGSLAATDHVAPWQPDRFNNPVPEFGHTRNLATSPDGRHAYLDTEDEGLVVFQHSGGGADPYVFLGLVSVSSGEVTFGPISSGGRIGMEDVIFDDDRYAVVSSNWQARATPNTEWTDISGTETTRELCAYTPTNLGEYRLVAEIRIDGELGIYSSNTIVKE